MIDNAKSMIGVNLTSPMQFNTIQAFTAAGRADYVEILIDNFFSCDPKTMRRAFGETPLALHIMNSQFIERDKTELQQVGLVIRRFIQELSPIYVSDHLAKHTSDGLPLPIMDEVDYDNFSYICNKVTEWQEVLGAQILLENFPSLTFRGAAQPQFMRELIGSSGCGMLFDISNAFLAWKNASVKIPQWFPVLEHVSHFHVGGFSEFHNMESIWVDSHDRPLTDETKSLVQKVLAQTIKSAIKTLTVEYDHNIDYDKWSNDLHIIKASWLNKSQQALCI